MIDVADEGIERAHALDEAARQELPFRRVEHARNDVEGDQPLGIAAFGIDGEGDADAAEQKLGLAALERERVGRGLLDPAPDQVILTAAVPARPHLVERRKRILPPCRRYAIHEQNPAFPCMAALPASVQAARQ